MGVYVLLRLERDEHYAMQDLKRLALLRDRVCDVGKPLLDPAHLRVRSSCAGARSGPALWEVVDIKDNGAERQKLGFPCLAAKLNLNQPTPYRGWPKP